MIIKIKFALILLIISVAEQAQNTVIKAGHFFDARSGKMLDNQIIIIHDRKIKEVGTSLKISKTDTVIDLSNSWVLPDLWTAMFILRTTKLIET
ncbi:MAG: hypothetical protein WKF59_20075 [Chitinophagaceae bacterium]